MRRLGICEEKGSGVDKVVQAAEAFQLPAPDFRVGERRTSAVLFAHTEIDEMDRNDRIRACYPPDLQDAAVKDVLAQAALLCADWAM